MLRKQGDNRTLNFTFRVLTNGATLERDTPEVLARYLTAFGPEFIGLTGDFEKIKEVMKPYGAFAEKEAVSDSAAGYLVSHPARLYLVNPQRELMLLYSFGFAAEDLRSDLTHLLEQEQL